MPGPWRPKNLQILTIDPRMLGLWKSRTEEILKALGSLPQDNLPAKEYRNELLNGWADTTGRTFTIVTSDPAQAEFYNPWYRSFAWNDIGKLEIIPVIEVGHLLQRLNDKKDPIMKR